MLLGAALYESSMMRTPPTVCTEVRPPGSSNVESRSAAWWRSTPHTCATPMANAAARAKCTPKRGRSIAIFSPAIESTTAVRALTWSSSAERILTSDASELPTRMTCAAVRARSRRTRGSSAASSANPSAGSSSTSSPFAASIASRSPARSACTASMAVTTPMRGRASVQSDRISPPTYIPISATNRSVPSGMFSRASGRPISLFAFPGVAATCASAPPSATRIASFVVVFPTEPVTPVTSMSKRARQCAASCASARGPSGVWRTLTPRSRARS